MAGSSKDELGKNSPVLSIRSAVFQRCSISKRNIGNFVVFTELLERVFLRVASAETDEQLERTVGTFLSPLLLKVASPHQDVKNKVKMGEKSLTIIGKYCHSIHLS